ncbi:MAG: Na/Pi cotransporter family protein, partial [Candidatus Aenigmatarchaeota archaeon]
FLMGMKIMSESLQRIAGRELRCILGHLTSNRFMGVGVGLTVTTLIQSSSATTVMTVGFVNAGIMTLQQAIGVILGANIGTTVTGWLVTLKIVEYSLPIIGVGVLLRFFSKNERRQYLGEAIFGFGILFLGMQTMKLGFAPLKESPGFQEFFLLIDGATYTAVLLGVLIGTITTVIVQSSSATIGIAIALASQGVIGFVGAVSLILGDNIGTTITAILASIGTNHNAKRVALAHTLFNVLGVAMVLMLFYPFVGLVDSIAGGDPDFIISTEEEALNYGMPVGTKPFIGTHIALAHTLFNVTNVITFLPLVAYLGLLCERLIPKPKGKNGNGLPFFELKYIHKGLVEIPAFAIAESKKEILAMAAQLDTSLEKVKAVIADKSKAKEAYEVVAENEKLLSKYKRKIDTFLLRISERAISKDDTLIIVNYMAFAHCLERMAYFSRRICKQYKKMGEKGISMSGEADAKLLNIFEESLKYYNEAVLVFRMDEKPASFAGRFPKGSKSLKQLIKDARLSHFERKRKGICPEGAAVFYTDILNILSNMAAQLYNMSEAAAGKKYLDEY